MTHEWAYLTIPKQQLVDVHRALLMRFVTEERRRQEQGLEAPEYPAFLRHIEQMLQITDEQAHALYHQLEDELWEYSWYNYTDEWAWHRAEQEVRAELGEQITRLPMEDLEKFVEQRYDAKFDRYVEEIHMQEDVEEKDKKKRVNRARKN